MFCSYFLCFNLFTYLVPENHVEHHIMVSYSVSLRALSYGNFPFIFFFDLLIFSLYILIVVPHLFLHFPIFYSEKGKALLGYQPIVAHQVTAELGTSSAMEARQGSPVRGIRSTGRQQSQG